MGLGYFVCLAASLTERLPFLRQTSQSAWRAPQQPPCFGELLDQGQHSPVGNKVSVGSRPMEFEGTLIHRDVT
jgi:hypothetical protein